MPSATWVKGKKKIKGYWTYSKFKNVFYINIFKKCPITGQSINLEIKGDTPEFNGWCLDKQEYFDKGSH